jgi:hypothetical protein
MVTLTPLDQAAARAVRETRLAELQQMLDKNIITKEEFEQRRQRLVSTQ